MRQHQFEVADDLDEVWLLQGVRLELNTNPLWLIGMEFIHGSWPLLLENMLPLRTNAQLAAIWLKTFPWNENFFLLSH